MKILDPKTRTYSELTKLHTFEDRYEYLRLGGTVGDITFGFDRYLNQIIYRSRRWLKARDIVIMRDEGCDLGIPDYQIGHRIFIHHMNPITADDIEMERSFIYEPEFLICVSENTHLAIHYSDKSLLPVLPIDRRPGDTCPWRSPSV